MRPRYHVLMYVNIICIIIAITIYIFYNSFQITNNIAIFIEVIIAIMIAIVVYIFYNSFQITNNIAIFIEVIIAIMIAIVVYRLTKVEQNKTNSIINRINKLTDNINSITIKLSDVIYQNEKRKIENNLNNIHSMIQLTIAIQKAVEQIKKYYNYKQHEIAFMKNIDLLLAYSDIFKSLINKSELYSEDLQLHVIVLSIKSIPKQLINKDKQIYNLVLENYNSFLKIRNILEIKKLKLTDQLQKINSKQPTTK